MRVMLWRETRILENLPKFLKAHRVRQKINISAQLNEKSSTGAWNKNWRFSIFGCFFTRCLLSCLFSYFQILIICEKLVLKGCIYVVYRSLISELQIFIYMLWKLNIGVQTSILPYAYIYTVYIHTTASATYSGRNPSAGTLCPIYEYMSYQRYI